ncbi:MAG: TonB-dependent receptor plug domain-containing protein, partial [Longimicrobiales bacterium]
MRMSKAGWLTAGLLAVAMLPLSAAAQDRGTLAGTVTDQTTDAPLAGVQITVTGTQLGTITNDEGRFVLVNVPVGPREVRVNSIGYASASQTVTVVAGETLTLEFALQQSAVALDELVVTGTVGAVERRAQPAVIASIDAAEQVERGTATSVTDLLTAQVPGVQVTSSSGTTGTAQQIRIRGASSIELSNEPLVFIDGVKASNRTLTDINIGGQGVSQLFDLNPEDIESIEVVKGPAAATLYGADASAGVIQIFTKQGRPGANRYTQTISMEYNQLEQNWTPPANFSTCRTAEEVVATSPIVLCRGQEVGAVISDSPLIRNNTFQDGMMRSLGYSGRGGGENYGYYLSLGWDDEEATLPNNALERRSGRVNFTFVPRSDLRFEAGLAIGNTESTFPINDNNIYGFLGGGLLGSPRSVREGENGGPRTGGWYIPTRDEEAVTNIESALETLRYTPTL